jgi:DNA-directed RNA polymerase specialized sigma24 family protein
LPAPEAAIAPAPSDDAWERAAFHELHGRSLHGFALLMMLGDRDTAGRCAGEAIASGMSRLDELRHPERAAAWLRRDVLARLPGRQRKLASDQLAALDGLGVAASVVAGLAALTRTQRAALVAADVERLGMRDVATVTGRSGTRLDRLLVDARRRYLAAYRASSPPRTIGGSIADHVATTARRALG